MPCKNFSDFFNIELKFGDPKQGLNFGYTAIPNFDCLSHKMEPGANYYEERYQKRLLSNLAKKAAALGYVLQENPNLNIERVS